MFCLRTSVLARVALVFFSGVRGMSQYAVIKNVLGEPIQMCGRNPLTGYFRDGFCATGPSDSGRHVVAAQVTSDFLRFTLSRGNDLMTAHPPSFPGLKPGDRWCLCALRWLEAYEAGVAPPVDLNATNAAALKYVSLGQLHAITDEQKAKAKQVASMSIGPAE